MKKTSKTLYKNNRGMATVEALPLLVLYVLLLSHALGVFGAIHTAILYSIHARTYAFETFRNRSDLTYFRDDIDSQLKAGASFDHYMNYEIRYHGIHNGQQIETPDPQWLATKRLLTNNTKVLLNDDSKTHGDKVNTIKKRNREVEVNPIWIKISYGICVTSNCGD